jgi:hypothetical protein
MCLSVSRQQTPCSNTHFYKYIYSISVVIPCLSTFLVILFLLELTVNSLTVRYLSLHGHGHIAEKFLSSSTDLLEERAVSILETDGEAKLESVLSSGKYIISQKTTRL